MEKMLDRFKSKEARKLFAEVKRELMRLEQPPNLKKSYLALQQKKAAATNNSADSSRGTMNLFS